MNAIGYDIVKVNVHSDKKANQIKKVKVGNFMLDMPGNNPHISNYKYEPQVNSQLGRLSACMAGKYPNPTAIDIGANVGDTIAVIKSHIDIPCIGIEGDPVSFSFMEKNMSQFANVTILKDFLGERRETIQVEMEKVGWNTTLVPSKSSHHELTLKTLDEVLQENNLFDNNLKIIKLDTEGFDTIILRGAPALIQKHRPVLYFEFNKSNMEAIGEDGLSTLFSLQQYGYRSVIFFDNKGRYMLPIPMEQSEIIQQLIIYSDEKHSEIAYYDICLFHEDDKEVETQFIAGEAAIR